MAGPEQQWRDFLKGGRIMLPRDLSTKRCFFPPRVSSPATGNDWDWVEASGHGTVYSVSMISPRPPAQPYAVALVDLAEGPRVMGQVRCGLSDSPFIGMEVRAQIEDVDGNPVLVFIPADQSSPPVSRN